MADGVARLRVGIEARALEFDNAKNTGVGHFLMGVVRALGEIDRDNRYVLVTVSPVDATAASLAVAPNIDLRPLRLPAPVFRWLQRHRRVPPIDALVRRIDVFLFTNFATLPLRRTPFSVVVHDLSFLLAPDTVIDSYRTRLVRDVPDAISRAGSVVVPSESVKRELVEHLSVPADKVVVASPGVDRTIFRPMPPAARADARARLGLPDRYFLFVGTLQPRKNVLRLLAAYCALPSDVRAREALVLAGMKGWRDEEIVAEIDRLRAQGARVHCTGYVEASDLPAVYSGATAFVWPSLYEGFGMPIVEAMACGVPVITSDRSSMPEAADGAALLVDPTDVDALSNAMRRIANDEQLADDLARRGQERSARADWHDTASHVLRALELAVGRTAEWSPRGESNS